jgi:hypothetical protein
VAVFDTDAHESHIAVTTFLLGFILWLYHHGSFQARTAPSLSYKSAIIK